MSDLVGGCVQERRFNIRRYLSRYWIEDAVYKTVSSKWCGNHTPPLSNDSKYCRGRFGGVVHLISFVEDGGEIGIGYRDKWLVILGRDEFNSMIAWYLWRWAYGEWFGLRRVIYFKLLNMRVNRHMKFMQVPTPTNPHVQ